MNVHVHIERLVVEGLPVAAAEEARIGDAFIGELTRLVASGGLSPSVAGGGAVPRLDVGSIRAPAGPVGLGSAVAAAVYRGIGR